MNARGLRYGFEVVGAEGRRVAEEIRSGRCRHSSFTFVCDPDVDVYWSRTADGTPLRTVVCASLGHISVCTRPAYRQTHVRVKERPAAAVSSFVSTPAAAAARRQYEQTAASLELDKLRRAHPRGALEVRDCA